MDIPIGDHGLYSSITNFRRSSDTNYTDHSEQLPFLNTLFTTILQASFEVEGVASISFSILHSSGLFKDPSAIPPGRLVRIGPVFWFSKRSLSHFGELWIIGPTVCMTIDRYYYRKFDVFLKLKNSLWGFALH